MASFAVLVLEAAGRCNSSDHQGLLASTPSSKHKIKKPVLSFLGIKGIKNVFRLKFGAVVKMGKKPPPPKPEELIEKLDEKVKI